MLKTHGPSDRRLYFTMGDEPVGNDGAAHLEAMVRALEDHAPEGLKWTFVDRSGSEEHRTMALISWLDAFRALYLLPARTGNSMAMVYGETVPTKPTVGPLAQANLAAGDCRREIARPVTFEQKNATPSDYYAWCLLMKPGSQPTAGNMGPEDYGRPSARASD